MAALVPQMRGVDAAVASCRSSESNEFLGGGVVGRCVDQGRGNAERPLDHGRIHQRLHAMEFRRRRRAVFVTEHHLADLGGADEGGEVDG